jgi:hypothetical protein
MTAYWFTQREAGGFPVERAVLGAWDVSVLHVAGEWQWLVRRDGRDVAEAPRALPMMHSGKPKPWRSRSSSLRPVSRPVIGRWLRKIGEEMLMPDQSKLDVEANLAKDKADFEATLQKDIQRCTALGRRNYGFTYACYVIAIVSSGVASLAISGDWFHKPIILVLTALPSVMLLATTALSLEAKSDWYGERFDSTKVSGLNFTSRVSRLAKCLKIDAATMRKERRLTPGLECSLRANPNGRHAR